ncbi:MAG: tRNA pseudouridine(38-40) synthase TruA [Candidatus Gastranaerophilales bacterium]|nr:tRNA pseudouridine(38-40) synthase TruA [Candidatus Gastranaerophilales bacterium]
MNLNEILNNSNNALSEKNSLLRYAVVVEYVGTSFMGSQIQPQGRTVQGEIESVLKILLSQEIRIIMAGRTDSGVHAKYTIAHFDVENELDCKKMVNSMNALLPPDISIANMAAISKDFHAQKSAKFKHYRYVINNGSQRSVWNEKNTHIRMDLNVEKMNQALSCIVGTHDFSAFKCAHTENPAVECTIYRAECTRNGDMIYLDFVGDRFLYNMVRIIVGSLIDVGRNEKSVAWFKEVLESKDRTLAGATAPSDGLMLMYIDYEEKYNNILNKEAIDENIFRKAS